jgi:uncharacterized DUF497 family protein
MEIDYDPAQDAANLARHGVSLAFGAIVIADAVGDVVDDRISEYGANHIKALAEINGLWFCCLYTKRNDVARIISVHRVRQRRSADG